ncbi:response regulator transcription factor [Paenibacillus sp. FSL R7-0297]|uniref:response regulator transcription factor n=1 Tax=unclassified Paenibacillus TaxID=185978 RepID=UPI0004F7CEBF|nr:response regulator transcription factor [Paenibacillus sp. FSL R5-0912]AIQ44377.1 PhoB family transcriptional regulator [Paenibacillus sp. FSL R5-0912]
MTTEILIVDDDHEIAGLIGVYLRNEGYHIHTAQDGIEALQFMERHSIDLVILDIMMPKMNGLEVCREIRKEQETPVLMLSAKAEDMDKIMGLMTGADDYMIKPFNPLELTARVKALLRRANYHPAAKDPDCIYIHSLTIDKQSHTVHAQGQEIRLTSIEFDILYLLAKNRGRVFGSEEIFEKVWNETGAGSNKTVMVHISNLRDKIAAATGETVIQTVWGVGYKIEK